MNGIIPSAKANCFTAVKKTSKDAMISTHANNDLPNGQSKHAYMIMAHKSPDQLRLLVELLDDERNDIFVHCDKKADPAVLQAFQSITTQKSNITVFSEINVIWGGYSLIATELALLKKAIAAGPYGYYHLLSGACLPIKTQDEIHFFFDTSQREFVGFCGKTEVEGARWRVEYPHVPGLRKTMIGWRVDNVLGKIRKAFSPKKHSPIAYGYGPNWFSITHVLAKDVLAHEDWIYEHFKHAFCGDELFLQSFVLTYGYENSLPGKMGDPHHTITNLRLVDWARGDENHPYTWRMSDYDQIMSSNMLFARKFSAETDGEIITAIYKKLKG